MHWYEWFIIPAAIVVIISVLLQQSDETALDAFTGEKSDLFKNKKLRGPELFLNYATLISSVLLVVIIVISSFDIYRWG